MNYRELIVKRGIANLKEFGYPSVNAENIITDYLYSKFFKSMLEESIGVSSAADVAIKSLLREIKDAQKSGGKG